jgi:hypothetical protein
MRRNRDNAVDSGRLERVRRGIDYVIWLKGVLDSAGLRGDSVLRLIH